MFCVAYPLLPLRKNPLTPFSFALTKKSDRNPFRIRTWTCASKQRAYNLFRIRT
jgi:hypothetical protein